MEVRLEINMKKDVFTVFQQNSLSDFNNNHYYYSNMVFPNWYLFTMWIYITGFWHSILKLIYNKVSEKPEEFCCSFYPNVVCFYVYKIY